MSNSKNECPINGCDLTGAEIPREYLEKGYYGPWSSEDGPRYYSRLIGHEVPGVYDGVLYWRCPDCGAAWPRFGETVPDLRDAAIAVIEGNNNEREIA